jgi:hypothetical protein
MFKKAFTTLLIVTCLFSLQCSSSQKSGKYNNKILGYWERVGDSNSGIIIKVDQLSKEDNYIGKIVYISKSSPIFEIGDLVWQDVKGNNSVQWTGNILGKKNTFWSGTVGKTYEAKFLLINDNLMEVYVDNNTQKWVRTKESAFNKSE